MPYPARHGCTPTPPFPIITLSVRRLPQLVHLKLASVADHQVCRTSGSGSPSVTKTDPANNQPAVCTWLQLVVTYAPLRCRDRAAKGYPLGRHLLGSEFKDTQGPQLAERALSRQRHGIPERASSLGAGFAHRRNGQTRDQTSKPTPHHINGKTGSLVVRRVVSRSRHRSLRQDLQRNPDIGRIETLQLPVTLCRSRRRN
jgi:hypothetical protein